MQRLLNSGSDWLVRNAGSAVDPWDPLSLPNLLGWWDASDQSKVTLVGSKVYQISDKSANNNHATQLTDPERPTIASANLNGRDVLDFGDTGNLWLNLTNRLTNVRSVHILAKWRPEASTSGQWFLLGDSVEYPFFCAANSPDLLSSWIGGQTALVGAGSKYVNGVLTSGELTKGANWTMWGFNPSANIAISQFSKDRGFNGRSINGWVAEVVLMSSAITDTDRTELQNYWASKYAL